MRKISKRILSFILTLVMILTMGLSGVVLESAKAADSGATVSFVCRGGNAGYVQVNTTLPSETERNPFLSTENGCNIFQPETQKVGWIGMDIDNGVIVLTFHFNGNLAAGTTYAIGKGSVFGFRDGTSYKLDADYTFTWDGSAWSCRKDCVLDMAYRGGDPTYLQTNHTISAGLTYDSGKSTLNYESSTNVPADRISFPLTGVLSINFGSDYTCTEGDTFTWKAGSTFVFQETTNQYVYYTLQNTWLFTYTSSGWNLKREVAVESVSGAAGYLQPILNISSTDNDTTLSKELFNEEGGTLTSSGIGSYNSNGKALLSVNLSKAATVGDTYVWNKGSTCTISGVECYFADTFVFTYTAEGWTVETKVPEQTFTFTSYEGGVSYLNVSTNIPINSACATSDIQTEGTKQYVALSVLGAGDGQTVQLLSFNYGGNHCVAGDTLKIKKGSTITLQDGSIYVLKENWLFVFNGSSWSSAKETEITGIADENKAYIQPLLSAPAPVNNGDTITVKPDETGSDVLSSSMSSHPREGSALVSINLPSENVTEGVHYIWNANSIIKIESTQYYLESSYVFTYLDGHWQYYKGALGDINTDEVVDSRDLVKLKRIQDNSLAYDIRYDLVADKAVTTLDVKRERYILIGASWESYTNSAEYLLAESNFNGGGEFVTFADCPADPTNLDKIQEYKDAGFNTSLVAVNDYNTGLGSEGFMTVEDTDYQLQDGERKLEFELNTGTKGLLQMKTNITFPSKKPDDFASNRPENLGHVIDIETTRPVWYYSWTYETTNKELYFCILFNDSNLLVDDDQVVLKAGTKLRVEGVDYVLDKNYTFTFGNYYLESIKKLKSKGLSVWLRNESNKANLFTEATLNKIAPYASDVDGVYFTDEPFWTNDMRIASNKLYNTEEKLMNFEDIKKFAKADGNFNTYFSGKYFHVNHSGVTSFNKYCTVPIDDFDMPAYGRYLTTYTTDTIVNASTDKAKKTIGFDHYPFGYKTFSYQRVGTKWYLAENLSDFQTAGISPYYLINLLISAKVAKENGNSMSVAIQTYLNTSDDKKKRAIEKKEEITMQLYATMACGVDVYEYYLYNTVTSENQYGIIDAYGKKTGLYTLTQNANKEALPFADVLKTFEWQGARFIKGKDSKNAEALNIVNNSNVAGLLLTTDNDGDLTNQGITAENDILVGYYKKGGQDAYMIANYNDPKLVGTPNSVTLNFGECNYARVYTGNTSGLTSEIVPLKNGKFERTLKPGGGCFVIPVNAAS